MDNIQATKKVLDENLYMTISVSDLTGNPWIANVFYVYDKDLHFYWYSSKETKHSSLIRENPKTAISIFNSTAVGDDVDAVYIEATTVEVDSIVEVGRVLPPFAAKLLRSKIVSDNKVLSSFVEKVGDFVGDSRLRLYRATPTRIYRLADVEMYKDKFIDSRVPIDLGKLIELC